MMEIGIGYILLGMALHVAEIAGILAILIMELFKDQKK